MYEEQRALVTGIQKRKGPILCYSQFRARALVAQTITESHSKSTRNKSTLCSYYQLSRGCYSSLNNTCFCACILRLVLFGAFVEEAIVAIGCYKQR